MNSFKNELDDITKTAKALALKIEKVQKQYAEMVKKHPKSPAKKAPSKKASPKKAGKTAVDTVLAIIRFAKFDAGDLSDGVRLVCGFQITAE